MVGDKLSSGLLLNTCGVLGDVDILLGVSGVAGGSHDTGTKLKNLYAALP